LEILCYNLIFWNRHEIVRKWHKHMHSNWN
jgi:hypothetical protein